MTLLYHVGGIYIKECKSTHKRDDCIPMFITALFTISKLWNQPRCPSTDEWIKKMWCIFTMEYYSDIKKRIMSPAGKEMEQEIMMLS
jgi:hypothetical protein